MDGGCSDGMSAERTALNGDNHDRARLLCERRRLRPSGCASLTHLHNLGTNFLLRMSYCVIAYLLVIWNASSSH